MDADGLGITLYCPRGYVDEMVLGTFEKLKGFNSQFVDVLGEE
jgi:hypothetical protein